MLPSGGCASGGVNEGCDARHSYFKQVSITQKIITEVYNMGLLDGLGGVVTGAGSGIGRAVTIRLSQEGGSVLAVDIAGKNCPV